MNSKVLFLFAIAIALAPLAFSQVAGIPPSGEFPLLGVIGAGILTGGVISLMKTRHQR